MLRHGIIRRPVKWTEIDGGDDFKALYIPPPCTEKPPSHIVFYCHGGGFAMGSSYFYLEFLLAWHATMCNKPCFSNPAMIAIEYTLVPDAIYPQQLKELIAAYNYTLQLMQGNAANICVAGDSAGGTLVLSMLLYLSSQKTKEVLGNPDSDQRPGFCVLISPWPTLVSTLHQNTTSDYLDAKTLEIYGKRYLGAVWGPQNQDLAIASPGSCTSAKHWAAASPDAGYLVMYGSEEVLARDITALNKMLTGAKQNVYACGQTGGIHAWPVAALYLAATPHARLEGIHKIVHGMYDAMETKRSHQGGARTDVRVPDIVVQHADFDG